MLAALDRVGVGREQIEQIPVLDTGEHAWLVTPPTGDWLACWRALRGIVAETGCWPLAIHPIMLRDPFTRYDMAHPEYDLGVAPREILERVPDLDVDAVLAREEARTDAWRPGADGILPQLHLTRLRFGAAPSPAEVESALGADPTWLALDRWLFGWELRADRETALTPTDRWYLKWHDPGEGVRIVLLPDPCPWAAGAYVGGFEWGRPHPDIRPAVARRWHERFGAEPVANWGTQHQLIAMRPPTDPWVAWELARECHLLWPDTAGGMNGIPTRDHARDLLALDRWYLHYRP